MKRYNENKPAMPQSKLSGRIVDKALPSIAEEIAKLNVSDVAIFDSKYWLSGSFDRGIRSMTTPDA
tara:strand:+ start:1689 stop:1886 length:198 start_codon:yes stop_codon:yes gene_type:complete